MTNGGSEKTEALLKKYPAIYAMYIEYPHKSLWTGQIGDKDYRTAVKNLLTADPQTPLLLYFHIPFCKKQCYYCTCHTYITSDYKRIKKHLDHLFMEVDLFRKMVDEVFPGKNFKPNFKEIHLGGGSPTLLNREDFDSLVAKLGSITDISKLSNFAIEIDPRTSNVDDLRYYHSKGINRISFGAQDFDPDVQKAVNRIQPVKLFEDLLTKEIRSYFHGINFDIMWGLPKQTIETFRQTMKSTVALNPDRISLLLMHYAPEVKKHQALMDKLTFPKLEDRTVMFKEAVETLTGNGYVRIGLEHFAKPDDELALALKKGSLHWNALGYTSGDYSDVIAFGTGSSSTITSDYYFQNDYSLNAYEATVEKGLIPVFRGYKLNEDDKIRRAVIHSLRTYFRISYPGISKAFNIDFGKYFAAEVGKLAEFEKDGIITSSDDGIAISEAGKPFTFHVCRVFDKYNA